jgi:hypothetical protein
MVCDETSVLGISTMSEREYAGFMVVFVKLVAGGLDLVKSPGLLS